LCDNQLLKEKAFEVTSLGFSSEWRKRRKTLNGLVVRNFMTNMNQRRS